MNAVQEQTQPSCCRPDSFFLMGKVGTEPGTGQLSKHPGEIGEILRELLTHPAGDGQCPLPRGGAGAARADESEEGMDPSCPRSSSREDVGPRGVKQELWCCFPPSLPPQGSCAAWVLCWGCHRCMRKERAEQVRMKWQFSKVSFITQQVTAEKISAECGISWESLVK